MNRSWLDSCFAHVYNSLVHMFSGKATADGQVMATWSNEEVFKLLDIWGKDRIQEQLEGCKRNDAQYTKILHYNCNTLDMTVLDSSAEKR